MNNMFNEIKSFFNTPFDELFDFSSQEVRATELGQKNSKMPDLLKTIKLDDGGLKGSIDELNSNFVTLMANYNSNNNGNNTAESITQNNIISTNNDESNVITEIKKQTVLMENQLNILTDGNRLAKNTILQMKNNGQGMIVS